MRAGVDAGGTFTDAVSEDGSAVKVPSTPEDPSVAVAGALAPLGGRPAHLAHGTTVATNALLEGRGAPVVLVATDGTADIIEIARQTRPALYDQWADRPPALVPRERRIEVGGRLAADGSELAPVRADRLAALPAGTAAVAVCLLHADVNPAHEQAVAGALAARGIETVCSHQVSPEFREYERMVTTVVDAMLRPVCRAYLSRLAPLGESVFVLSSAGGLMPLAEAAEHPAALLLSGPAAGAHAGAAAARAAGFPDAATFDMGGTSTDVCLVRDGVPEPAGLRSVSGYPIRLPALDIHTIGAGGGSIARLDAGGALVVGPESAGAVPGPACYGRGGTHATVTDADLVAGRILERAAFPGLGRLNRAAAAAALAAAAVDAAGVVAVVDEAMVAAIRVVTVARGVDPRELALVAFGGAGPLHACAVADALGMRAVVVPPRAGVLSAVGLLAAPRQVDLVRSWPRGDGGAASDDAARELAGSAARALGEEPASVQVAFDCRYAGQGHELTVASVAAFHAEHERRNGFARLDAPVEVIAIRATARGPVVALDLPVPPGRGRGPHLGPRVMAEDDCTIWVPPGWAAELGGGGAWIIRRVDR
jgi:N-methylhydantoinase A/oxoprolinase/acetone carboxylase beta subunit